MPHCIVHYSAELSHSLEIKDLLAGLRDVVADSDLFEVGAIKMRAMPYAEHLMSAPYTDFIYVELKLLAGRTSSQKAALAQHIQAYLQQQADQKSVSLTTDIVEIDKECYQN